MTDDELVLVKWTEQLPGLVPTPHSEQMTRERFREFRDTWTREPSTGTFRLGDGAGARWVAMQHVTPPGPAIA